jgi:hypothetical protein
LSTRIQRVAPGTADARGPGMTRNVRLFMLAHLALVMLASFGT